MVNPIKNQNPSFSGTSPRKKAPKEIELRVKKAVKKSKPSSMERVDSSIKASSKISAQKTYLTAEKASVMARQRAFELKKAAVQAQKAAFLAQRAHMAQQAAAARKALAAEKAKKAAEKAAKKAAALRRTAKIKAYLAKPEEKKQRGFLKKKNP